MQVGSLLPIKTLIDRGSKFPINLKDPIIQEKLSKNDDYKMINTLKHYWKFIDYQKQQNKLVHETLEAGTTNQIKLKNTPENFPDFRIQNIAVNGKYGQE